MRLPRLRRFTSDVPARSGAVGTARVASASASASDDDLEFLALHREVSGRFHSYAERFVSREDARDAVADAMAVLWERWATLEPGKRNPHFAFGILRHCVLARLAVTRPLVALDGDDIEVELEQRAVQADEDAERDRAGADRDARIAEVRDRVLAQMPVRRREVLLLILEHAISFRDAAEALGVTKGTVSQHVSLGYATFRAAFIRAGIRGAVPTLHRLRSPEGGAPE